MSQRLKSLATGVLNAAAVPRIYHRVCCPGALTICMYHAVVETPLEIDDWCFVRADRFEQQIAYLARHFEVLPLGEALERLGRGELRRPTAAITFDDGYQNNSTVALPILARHRAPATVFLCTAMIDSDDTPWFCRLNDALARTQRSVLSWEGTHYDISTPELRVAAGAALQDALKALGDHERMLTQAAAIVEQLGSGWNWPIARDSAYRMLDTEAVQRMLESGLIDFGAHTANHTILTHVDAERARREIAESVEGVAILTGRPCRLFAYPNGRAADFAPAHGSILKQLGVSHALSTIEGPNTPRTEPLALRRYGIGSDMDNALFGITTHHLAWRLSGVRP